MEKQQVIEYLTKSKVELKNRYGVARLALFGSTSRDEIGRAHV